MLGFNGVNLLLCYCYVSIHVTKIINKMMKEYLEHKTLNVSYFRAYMSV